MSNLTIKVVKPIIDNGTRYAVGDTVDLASWDAEYHIKAGHAIAATPAAPPAAKAKAAPDVADAK